MSRGHGVVGLPEALVVSSIAHRPSKTGACFGPMFIDGRSMPLIEILLSCPFCQTRAVRIRGRSAIAVVTSPTTILAQRLAIAIEHITSALILSAEQARVRGLLTSDFRPRGSR